MALEVWPGPQSPITEKAQKTQDVTAASAVSQRVL